MHRDSSRGTDEHREEGGHGRRRREEGARRAGGSARFGAGWARATPRRAGAVEGEHQEVSQEARTLGAGARASQGTRGCGRVRRGNPAAAARVGGEAPRSQAGSAGGNETIRAGGAVARARNHGRGPVAVGRGPDVRTRVHARRCRTRIDAGPGRAMASQGRAGRTGGSRAREGGFAPTRQQRGFTAVGRDAGAGR